MSLRIRKGDKVVVLTGKDKGKAGKVLHVYPKKSRALVEGINFVKKHVRKSQQHPQGAVLNQEATIHVSNLRLLHPPSPKFSRIRALVAGDGSKQRISAKSKAVIESHER